MPDKQMNTQLELSPSFVLDGRMPLSDVPLQMNFVPYDVFSTSTAVNSAQKKKKSKEALLLEFLDDCVPYTCINLNHPGSPCSITRWEGVVST